MPIYYIIIYSLTIRYNILYTYTLIVTALPEGGIRQAVGWYKKFMRKITLGDFVLHLQELLNSEGEREVLSQMEGSAGRSDSGKRERDSKGRFQFKKRRLDDKSEDTGQSRDKGSDEKRVMCRYVCMVLVCRYVCPSKIRLGFSIRRSD